MKVTFFLLLVAAVAFLAVFQPAVEAAPQDIATAVETGPAEAAETGSDGKPEGGAAAGGSSSEEQGGKKGHGKGKGHHGGKGGKGGEKGGEKGGKGKFQANKEKGAKGQDTKTTQDTLATWGLPLLPRPSLAKDFNGRLQVQLR
ncbi:hypothetical protein pipiens_012020 [Culex pipiens pipiens]|uniref:Uncharacterized protein n=1 Tax=Culex pipiens pipiens TaxID=38569 RepID=A0ABD1D406_CULPP